MNAALHVASDAAVVWMCAGCGVTLGPDDVNHVDCGGRTGVTPRVKNYQLSAPTAAGADVVDLFALDESWTPEDLGPVIAGDVTQPMPTILHRADWKHLLYPASINGVHGDSGAGKGFVCCYAIDQEVRADHTVMLIDYEDVATSIVARLISMGTPADRIRDRLIYIRPQTAFGPTARDQVIQLCNDRAVALVIIDSLGEAFAIEGVDENKDVEVGPWYRRVARPIADAGPAVLIIDHSTKASDNPLHPSGSKRKRAAITGGSYLAEAIKPFVKFEGGRLRLTCAKDRHGNYRKGEVVANLVMAASVTDRVRLELHAPDVDQQTETLGGLLAAKAAVKAAQSEGRPLSKSALRGVMKIKTSSDNKRAGIDLAISRGALREAPGPRGARLVEYVHDLEAAT